MLRLLEFKQEMTELLYCSWNIRFLTAPDPFSFLSIIQIKISVAVAIFIGQMIGFMQLINRN